MSKLRGIKRSLLSDSDDNSDVEDTPARKLAREMDTMGILSTEKKFSRLGSALGSEDEEEDQFCLREGLVPTPLSPIVDSTLTIQEKTATKSVECSAPLKSRPTRSTSSRKQKMHAQVFDEMKKMERAGLRGITFDSDNDESEGVEDVEDNIDDFIASEDEDSASEQEQEQEQNASSGDDTAAISKATGVDSDADDGISRLVTKKSRKRNICTDIHRPTDSDDGNAEADVADNSDEEQSDQLLYLRVNASLEDMDDDNDFAVHKTMTIEEALVVYLQLIANALISKSFSERQIENLVCTHRESLLASSAWQPDFLAELKSRPYYMCSGVSASFNEMCQACGRSAQNADYQVTLFGPSYDANKSWADKWPRSFPKQVFCFFKPPSDRALEEESHLLTSGKRVRPTIAAQNDGNSIKRLCTDANKDAGNEQEDGEDDQDEQDNQEVLREKRQWWQKYLPRIFAQEKVSEWFVASHCKCRTQLYHSLLHYKLRLALQIREYLEAHAESELHTLDQDALHSLVTAMLEDKKFVNQEMHRLQSVLVLAGSKFGGQKYEQLEREVDIWSGRQAPKQMTRIPSSSLVATSKTTVKEEYSVQKVQSRLTSFFKPK